MNFSQKIRTLKLNKFLTIVANSVNQTNNSRNFKFKPSHTYRNLFTISSLKQSHPKNVYLLDETTVSSKPSNYTNMFTERTHNCGELLLKNVGERVTLCGWLEFQRLNKFAVLRDSYGHVQLLIHDKDLENQKLLIDLPYESIIKIQGTVLSRPKDMINKKQKTGEIEVLIEKLDVLNKANQQLPFNIREFQKANEGLRMHYRYMDLRFPEMQKNLRIRSQFLMSIREFLINKCNFVDVETPTLFKATPGGHPQEQLQTKDSTTELQKIKNSLVN